MRVSRAWERLLLVALALNTAWEGVQCGFFFEMNGDWVPDLGWMIFAVIGDGTLVLGVVWGASRLVGVGSIVAPDARGWCAMLVLGLGCGLVVEWSARELGFWNFGPLMPTIEVFGASVGIVPLAQMSLLPARSAFIAGQMSGKFW